MCSSLWFVFFFSSRRRHTRFDCDWSSDVCSSDLLFRRPETGRHDSDAVRHGNDVADARKAQHALCVEALQDRKSTRLNSSHSQISYAVFCLKKKKLMVNHRLQQSSLLV